MPKHLERSIYTDNIKGFFNTEPVKIITGIRRCGKSEIVKLLVSEARKITDEEHIIYINLEDMDFAEIDNYKALNTYITEKINDDKKYYIFLDEVQAVYGWEKVVNSLRLKNTDIYITGSNSQLLSGEMATLLAGRYVAFEVSTLSFAEFMYFRKECGVTPSDIDEYIRVGGFPLLSTSDFSDSQTRQIIGDIQSSVILKDVVSRYKIKNAPLLERIIAFLYDNVGSLVSLRKISDYLKSNGGGTDHETVSSYVGYLENAYAVKRVPRYDIKGKRLLESNDKYFLADHSLQYAVRDMKRTNLAGILENIVFCELNRRGYKVYIGKLDTKEIDFIAERINGNEKIYVQVCSEYTSLDALDREFSPLLSIKDNYPKYVVTLDKHWQENRQGVTSIHLKDFLLKPTL